MDNLLIVIPAIKKNAVIPDQLIKKLNGITLIQRAINTAKEISKNILIVTDSQEISLIAKRNNIAYYLESNLHFDSNNILDVMNGIIENKDQNIFLYRANTPLIDSDILKKAYQEFLTDDTVILTSVKSLDKQLFRYENNVLKKSDIKYFKELKAFYIYKKNEKFQNLKPFKPYIIESEISIEIESYQDWWICEKVLQRKRIVFHVIGNTILGMGHIYHSLALAHEITDHEVIFVCDEKYKLAVDKIASMDYKVIASDNVEKTIIDLQPDIVINDILNTSQNYMKVLKEKDIKLVNFEDLGEGSSYADIVFNELYDSPQLNGKQYRWGYKYLALRDEFIDAKPHNKDEKVTSVLITFGGTDQNNLTLTALESILPIVQEKNLKIYIVCGSGYLFKQELEEYLKDCSYKNIELTYASNVISQIMEKTQIAISSNGRTVYELAHMNIPSIIISHHKREATHTFASLEKGFINLGVYNTATNNLIREKFQKMVKDNDYRELLFMNIRKYDFLENKQRVVKEILGLL